MVPALRNRWLWVSMCLLASNVAVGALWWRSARSRPPTRVLRVDPAELSSTEGPLTVSFSRPMVPAEETGVLRPLPEFVLRPPVLLAGVWRSPSLLELRAMKPLAAATPYELTIPRLLDAEGQAIAGERAHSFRTEPLRVVDVRQVALRRDWTLTLRAVFNDEVALADLDRALAVVDEDGAAVPVVRKTQGDAAREVDLATDPKRRREVKVTFAAGLRGVHGPLGLASPAAFAVGVESGLGLRDATGVSHDAEDGSIHLSFGLQVDPGTARGFIAVDPPVRHQVEGNGGGLVLRGAFRPGDLYRVTVRAGLPAEGGRFLPDEAVRSVRMPDLEESVAFLGDGRFLVEEGSRTLLLRTVNADAVLLGAERIYPNNLVHHLHGSRNVGASVLVEKRIPIQGGRNRPALTRLDLKDLLGAEARGPFHVRARVTGRRWLWAERTVAVTDLGIHLKRSPQGFLAWVVRLSDLSPVEGARVAVLSAEDQEVWSAETDREGIARWDGRPDPGLGEPFLVTARKGDDLSYVPLAEAGLSLVGLDASGLPYPREEYEAFVYPERGVIRPGESLHLRAIARDRSGQAPPAGTPVAWEITRPDGKTALAAPATLSPLGTAELAFASQAHHPTGAYRARLRLPGEGEGSEAGPGDLLGETSFRLEEYLPETLRVELSAEERRYGPGEEIAARVRAENLFGGPAQGLAVTARLELQPQPFVHPGWPGVVFSTSAGRARERRPHRPTIEAGPATLDERGEAEVRFVLPAELEAPAALQAAITATVLQVSGRGSSARIVRPVDPAPFYFGLRAPGLSAGGDPEEGRRRGVVVRAGEDLRVEAIAVRPDGKPHALERIEARVHRLTWSHSLRRDPGSGSYRWSSERLESPVASFEVACPEGRGEVVFRPEAGGEYRLDLSAAREAGERPVQVSLGFLADGGGSDESGPLEVPSRIALIPDRPHYRPGETARVRVRSPITGTALLATESDRVHQARTFLLAEAETTLEVPVGEDMLPHGYVTLTVVRSGLSGGPRGVPLRAYGAAPLRRDPSPRVAHVELSLPTEVRPGARLAIEFTVRRPDGAPEDAEAAVALVDAGILALTGFRTPDPLAFFQAQRALGTRAADLYSMVVPEAETFLAHAAAAPGGDGGGEGAYLSPIAADRVRSVSIWKGGLAADSEGRVRLELPAPDFDGELMVMAVAAGRSSLGSAGRAVKVRRPLVMEPGLPRFLAPGDRFLAPVNVHNTTGGAVRAGVEVALAGGLRLADGASARQELDLPPGGSAAAWFALEAVETGKAEATFTLRAPALADLGGEEIVKRVELPVRPAAPPVTRFESRTVETGKPVVFVEGQDLLPGTARGELVLSTSILPSLEGSLRYLLRYPYGCLEQTTSSLIPWIALRDYLKATGSEEYTDAEIEDRVRGGVERLFSMQAHGGGLGWWSGDRNPYDFGSVHAASVLIEARAAGYEVPGRPLERLLDYLETVLAHPRREDPRSAAGLRAYALQVLARAGRPRRGWIESLHERRDELGDEGRAHLAVAAALARLELPGVPLLDPQAVLSRGVASEAFARELSGSLYSRPRELCFVLGALQELGWPREELLPILDALTGLRQGGRFRSTHEDGLFVFALGKLAKLFPPSAGPAKVTVEAGGAEPRAFEVRDRLSVPLGALEGPLEVSLEGDGPLYAFLETRGVPVGRAIELDEGLRVRRAFLLPGGDPRPARPFRQGESFIIEVRLESPRALQNVVVVDALPAGFEIENPALATSDGRSEADKRFGIVRSEARDDRLVLFCHPRSGESRYRYVARAVTAGSFALPPIAAECMYDGAIHGVHGAGRVEVERR